MFTGGNLWRNSGSQFGNPFEKSSLPRPNYAVGESGEVDESGTAEGPGAINESEIVESEEAHLEGIRRHAVAKKNIVTAEYADSCSDSNDDADVDFWLVHDSYFCLIWIILYLTNNILKFLHH